MIIWQDCQANRNDKNYGMQHFSCQGVPYHLGPSKKKKTRHNEIIFMSNTSGDKILFFSWEKKRLTTQLNSLRTRGLIRLLLHCAEN